jgi:predicted Zn-dependent protease
MKRFLKTIVAVLIAVFLLGSCSTVPITGRRQLSLMPESEMISMAMTSYSEFMKENPVSTNQAEVNLVKETGKNISEAVIKHFAENNLSSQLKGYQWEFNLISNDTTPNAWCMPGGKVVVYSGILPYTKDKNGLAVVVSHEIAHAVARHGSERMSQQLLLQMGGIAMSEAVKNKPDQTKGIFNGVFGLGAQLGVILPYSREHEYEADKLGLIFMAMAGYQPEAAIEFWERMSSMGGQKPPAFLSTHPSDAARIQKIREVMPEVMTYYKKP